MSNINKVLLVIAVISVVLLGIVIGNMDLEKEESKMKIGCVLSGSVNEEGWNGMHYSGIKSACKVFDVELIVKENVQEFKGECVTAVKELAKEQVNVIILTSYNYSDEVYKLVKKYPDIAFYCNSSEYHDKNMTSYYVRYYQGRYLAGILAGLKTKTDNIGYIAAMANNEVNRGINAFTLGVKSVNKDAEVFVTWTDSWDNEKKEKKLANNIIKKKNVDVITYHQNKSYVIEIAEKNEIYSIGYHEAVNGFSDAHLATVTCDWEKVYNELIKECLQGRANEKKNFWIGMEKGVVDISKLSDEISESTAKKIEKAKKDLINGKEIFSGVIYDTKGKKRCDKGETISDDILLEHMDWYVEGVKIYEDK